jgi:dihydroorotate dehydrogenase
MEILHVLYRASKPVLFLSDPEDAHTWFVAIGEFLGRTALGRWLTGLAYRYRGPDIGKTVDGIKYEIPMLLSAGFDPDGRLTQILRSMSFGGEEIGSTTAYPCAGNPKPRMTRLVRNQSIIVYKGLRNKGVDALIKKLQHTKRMPGYVTGISIALTNHRPGSCETLDGAIDDYAISFKKLNEAGVGDYYTLNISCPNAAENAGEMFADPKKLEMLLQRIKQIPSKKPLYLKMPINRTWEEFTALCAVADRGGVRGLIIGNLNKNYADLDHPEDAPKEFRGGLSGKPCFELSNELLRKTREMYGTRFTLIGVGGVITEDDAMEKFRAGADLIMLVSGMIFNSPSLMKLICKRYAAEMTAGHL